ncbi:MAG: hypothetical protein QOD75_2739 [Blastocatellia bacterium]|jgi:hypothetical protein|nr:hypothetical protein [Blastocatellia bacterium]
MTTQLIILFTSDTWLRLWPWSILRARNCDESLEQWWVAQRLDCWAWAAIALCQALGWWWVPFCQDAIFPATYAGLVIVGMRLIAGPAREDRLARQPSELA